MVLPVAVNNRTFYRSYTSESHLRPPAHPHPCPGVESDSSGRPCLTDVLSFMALEPHPCPDVIYWAADSKQLVIAQPERVSTMRKAEDGRDC